MFGDDGVEMQLPQKTSAYALTRAAIDVQIATAKSYPRSLQQVGTSLKNWCTSDDQTAESCVYSLTRGNKTIRGPSIRFAEILAAAWGHMRVDARIVDEGRDFIVVRGECHDLQSNNVWAQDVTRRITNSAGRRYDADLIGVTMMAAASIAQRDSVLKCIPAFIWRPAFDACVSRIVGDVKTLNDRRIKAVGQFSMLGVTADQVFRKLGVPDINGVTADHLVDLVGTFNAIREGETSIEAVFGETRIVGRSQGGSPLGAAEDDGKDEETTELPKKEERDEPASRVASDGVQPAQKPDVRADDQPHPTGRTTRGGSGAKPARESRARGRQDKDADASQKPAASGASAAAPAAKSEPAAAAQQPTAARQAEEPAKPAEPGPASDAKGSTPAARTDTSPEAILRRWEEDCDRCSTLDQLKALAVQYGPIFDGKLNEEQEEMSRDTWDASKERVEKEEAARRQREAAEAYERAQNGDDEPGEADAPAPAAKETPAPAKPVSPMIERCADMAPGDPKHLAIWHEIITTLDAAANQQEVMDRYAEMEKSGLIKQLPEDSELNTRTIRFRVKGSKPK